MIKKILINDSDGKVLSFGDCDYTPASGQSVVTSGFVFDESLKASEWYYSAISGFYKGDPVYLDYEIYGNKPVIDENVKDITFENPFPHNLKNISVSVSSNVAHWYSNMSTSGFTVNLSSSTSGCICWRAVGN